MLSTIANLKSYIGTSSFSDAFLTQILTAASGAITAYCGRVFELATYRELYNGDGTSEIQVDNYPIISVSLLSLGKIAAFELINNSSGAYNACVSVTASEMSLTVSGGNDAGTSRLTLATYTTMESLIAAITALNKSWGVVGNTSLASWAASEILPITGASCLNKYASILIPDTPETDFSVEAATGIIKLWGRYPAGFQNITIKYVGGYATIPADIEQICLELAKNYLDAKGQNASLQSENIGNYSYSVKSETSNAGIPAAIQGRLNSWRRYLC